MPVNPFTRAYFLSLTCFLEHVTSGQEKKLGSPSLALPLGELSPQVTERALSVLAALGHLSQRERQG